MLVVVDAVAASEYACVAVVESCAGAGDAFVGAERPAAGEPAACLTKGKQTVDPAGRGVRGEEQNPDSQRPLSKPD